MDRAPTDCPHCGAAPQTLHDAEVTAIERMGEEELGLTVRGECPECEGRIVFETRTYALDAATF